ncbi:MAG: 3-isopropylmalate dehydratase small subunit [Pseudomonadota bacterium]
MQAIHLIEGLVAPLDRDNVDTDAIIPKQFLKSVRKTGFGPHLFDEWRWLDHGEPGMDLSGRIPNPQFVLNEPRFAGASILLGRRNFGCGSSREHAVWALAQYGFQAVIAPDFADIFRNNALKNGLLTVALPAEVVDDLFQQLAAAQGYRLRIDLEAQTVALPDGRAIGFDIDAFRKDCLLRGLDDVALVLQSDAAISAYEAKSRERFPWLYAQGATA